MASLPRSVCRSRRSVPPSPAANRRIGVQIVPSPSRTLPYRNVCDIGRPRMGYSLAKSAGSVSRLPVVRISVK
jgi:hypothetical protein